MGYRLKNHNDVIGRKPNIKAKVFQVSLLGPRHNRLSYQWKTIIFTSIFADDISVLNITFEV